MSIAYPRLPFKFPEQTTMTMTTREVTIFLGELGQIRQLLGEVGERITKLEQSVALCQSRCNDDRGKRSAWIRYAGAIITALIPAAFIYFMQSH